jgi:hypothetical protein
MLMFSLQVIHEHVLLTFFNHFRLHRTIVILYYLVLLTYFDFLICCILGMFCIISTTLCGSQYARCSPQDLFGCPSFAALDRFFQP